MSDRQTEAEFDKLFEVLTKTENQLKKAEAVIEFYAKMDNWIVHKNRGLMQEIRTIHSNDCTKHEDCGYTLKMGGKKARQYFQDKED
jgi:hypothetical protein